MTATASGTLHGILSNPAQSAVLRLLSVVGKFVSVATSCTETFPVRGCAVVHYTDMDTSEKKVAYFSVSGCNAALNVDDKWMLFIQLHPRPSWVEITATTHAIQYVADAKESMHARVLSQLAEGLKSPMARFTEELSGSTLDQSDLC